MMMTSTRMPALMILCAGLVACATTPPTAGPSLVQQKVLSFPPAGEDRFVKPGSLVHLQANYSSRSIYRIKTPFASGFMLGRISVSTDVTFLESEKNGKKLYCSQSRVYIDPLTGPIAPACFMSSDVEGSPLDQVMAAPGMVSFTKDVTPPVVLVRQEIPEPKMGPLKRELVYDGKREGMFFFTQSTYEQSLEKPSRVRPIIVKSESFPVMIFADGAELSMHDEKDGAITIRLNKAWQ